MKTVLAIIGGSGLYEIDGLQNLTRKTIKTPWGEPSAPFIFGTLNGIQLIFLARHGQGHRLSPADINYRANIDALKRAGATDILSISSCGSLNEALTPGTFVLVDQFIDRTVARANSFFGNGIVAHVSMAKPTCGRLADVVAQAATTDNIAVKCGGIYLAMEGPQFSTYAESMLYRSWGCDVIGMTNMPEARLAREAEMCYQTVAMVTDFDCWHPDHAEVNVQAIIKTAHTNVANAKKLINSVTQQIANKHHICSHGCDRALDHAIITAEAAREGAVLNKLDAIAGRILTTVAV